MTRPAMRSALAVMLLLGLAACASATTSPAEEDCRRRAYDDPAVRDALLRSNSQQQQIRGPALIELDGLVRQKTRQCLGAEGVIPRGGVEPVKPY